MNRRSLPLPWWRRWLSATRIRLYRTEMRCTHSLV